jgi:hypothetical protein
VSEYAGKAAIEDEGEDSVRTRINIRRQTAKEYSTKIGRPDPAARQHVGTTLALWFRDGRMAYFESVEDFRISHFGNELDFSYFDVFDVTQVRRWAHFEDISGYALSRPLPEREPKEDD